MMEKKIRVLVLGATGMLGNAVMRFFSQSEGFHVMGSARSTSVLRLLPASLIDNIICGTDVENMDNLISIFAKSRPDVVINCIGLVKQLKEVEDPLMAIPINALLPHRLAKLCDLSGARLVHMSTDCIFSGAKGFYKEGDMSDAKDMYGRSKYLGEVDYPHAITLRTSIIGHELTGSRSLVDWFLAQNGSVKGYTKAIFSGLPTVEIARVIRDFVIPNLELRGLYHLSAEPINKFNLLNLVAKTYGKSITIIADDGVSIDRSLDSSKFRQATGYQPHSWPELVNQMHKFH